MLTLLVVLQPVTHRGAVRLAHRRRQSDQLAVSEGSLHAGGHCSGRCRLDDGRTIVIRLNKSCVMDDETRFL